MATETEAIESGAADAAHGGAEAAGMPQLEFSTFPNQIFWLVVTLVAIYLILTKVALPRIEAVLAERSGTITNDIASAEEMKLKASEAEAAYNQALADARAEAQKIIAEARAGIQAELDAATAKADAQISAKAAESEKRITEIRQGALAAIKEVATDVTQDIVVALGGKADAKAVASAVAARMKG